MNGDKDCIWKNDPHGDIACKGIRVKFSCGGSAAGCVYPIVIVVSNLSNDEFHIAQ